MSTPLDTGKKSCLEIPSHQLPRKEMTIKPEEDMRKEEISHMTGEDANWYCLSENQYEDFSKKLKPELQDGSGITLLLYLYPKQPHTGRASDHPCLIQNSS